MYHYLPPYFFRLFQKALLEIYLSSVSNKAMPNSKKLFTFFKGIEVDGFISNNFQNDF